MATGDTFYCDKEEAKDDEFGNKMTMVRCHGRLVTETSLELKAMVKALISNGGRIIVDLSDVSHLDSSGLGTLVGLKASAINHGYCILELENMTPRILELLRITNLTHMFAK
jgi:anti-sigma B factor antagonist